MTRLRACFVGDSITCGQGDERFLSWPGRVGVAERSRGHDVTVYNLGVRSDTSKHVSQRYLQECAVRLPDRIRGVVVFAFGLNDATEEQGALRVPLGESLAVSREILVTASSRWHCLWVGPTPIDDASQPARMDSGELRTKRNAVTHRLNVAFAELAGSLGVPYLDVYNALLGVRAWTRSELFDGVHPNAAGYERLASTFGAWPAWRALLDP